MMKKLWAGFAMGLLMFGAVTAQADTTAISMELTNWNVYGTGIGTINRTPDGIKFYGSGCRNGDAFLETKHEGDFSNTTMYFKWMVGGGGYRGVLVGVGKHTPSVG